MKSSMFLAAVVVFTQFFCMHAARRPMPCFGDSDCEKIGLCSTAGKSPACMDHKCACLDQKPECMLDYECATIIDCGLDKPDHDKYCHSRRCHCHKEVECNATTAAHCPTLTGCRFSVCDKGHCHPTERDSKCAESECRLNQDCATKINCGPHKTDHDKYCNIAGLCRCHIEVECTPASASKCPELTGCRNSICEQGRCHPTDRDDRICDSTECTVNQDCSTKIVCGTNEAKYCHEGRCRCHVKCTPDTAAECPTLTGCANSVCVQGQCLPTSLDTNCNLVLS